MSKSRAYEVEFDQHGYAGYVFYVEQGKLPFSWEMLGGKGRGIDIPLPHEWDAYCEIHKANWGKGRREEIVKAVAEGMLKKWYGNGTYEIVQDRWLNIYPGPSLLSRLLGKLK